jgi:hypothetical protein
MTAHLIDMLLGGCLDPDRLALASILPPALRRVERSDDYAPDYQIDGEGSVNLGSGWSQTASRSGIPI